MPGKPRLYLALKVDLLGRSTMNMETPAFRVPGAVDDGEPLGALDWSTLLARLGAERDLRRELSGQTGLAGAGGASFAAAAASALGHIPLGEAAINPEALADGKATQANSSAAQAETPAPGIEARGQK